jgi:hypothetical protein
MRTYVRVKFKQTDKQTYTYLADGAVEELADYTHAVVDSPYGGLTVVDVVKFDTLDESSYEGDYKDVITLFDLSKHNNKLAQQARKKALEKELRRRVAQRKLEDNFAALLQGDEEGLKMLEEFKKL